MSDYRIVTGRRKQLEERIAELQAKLDAAEATINRVREQAPSGPHYHHPDCNYWKWDWRYSWDDTDCNCDKVVGPALAGDKP